MSRSRKLPIVVISLLAGAALWAALSGGDETDRPTEVAGGATPTESSPTEAASRAPRRHTRGSDGAGAEMDGATVLPRSPPGQLVLHVIADEDDEPIRGARIEWIFDDDRPPATTDELGDVTLEVPMADEHPNEADTWIEVGAPGRAAESVHVTVAAGAVQRETVHLEIAFSVSGTVRDTTGQAIAGAQIVAGDGMVCITPAPEIATATSDASGRFRLDGLPLDAVIEYTIADGEHTARRLRRGRRDSSPLDIVLDDGGTLRGVLRGPDGAPVAGGRVRVKSLSHGYGELVGIEPTWSAEDGHWEIGGLALDSRWEVTAGHGDFMDSVSLVVEALGPDRRESSCDLVLRPLATVIVDLDFAAPHAPSTARLLPETDYEESCPVPGRVSFPVRTPGGWAVRCGVEGLGPQRASTEIAPGETKTLRVRFDEGASLAGLAVDDTGAAVGNATIQVDANGRWPREAVAGPDGRFVVSALEEGPHEVTVTATNHAQWTDDEVDAPADALRCELPRFGVLALQLRAPDGTTPPTSRWVHWNDYPVYGSDEGPWDAGRVEQALPPGSYIVAVRVAGYVKWEERDIEVFPGEHTETVEIELDPGVRLTGRVVDPDGEGVPWATLFFDLSISETDGEGNFRSPPLAEGVHEVHVYNLPGVLEARVEVDHDTPPLLIRQQRGSLVQVTISGPTREKLDECWVRVSRSDSADDADAEWLDEPDTPELFVGRFAPGPHRISVVREDEVVATREVELRDGHDVAIEITLAK